MPLTSVLKEFQRLWKVRGLALRVLFCWGLGASLSLFDEVKDYDLRFQMRGEQSLQKDIVLVYFTQDEWSAQIGPAASRNLLRSLKEFTPTINDSFYWHPRSWDQLLSKILSHSPQSVGVTFFFDEYLTRPEDNLKSLRDPRVVWAGHLDSEGRPALPLTASNYGYNVGLLDFREDEDRILRRVNMALAPLPHMALKMAEMVVGKSANEFNDYLVDSMIINFRKRAGSFQSVSAVSVLKNQVPPEFFRNKIVIIGSQASESPSLQTPVGRQSRSDVLAQVVDNVIENRWIKRSQPWASSIYLLGILLLTVLILTQYPQTVALIALLWLGLGTTALSIWIFDSYYIWIPAFSPAILIMIGYMVLIGYQLAVKEGQAWRLQQETTLLSELDQLRNNFISLISHDLKTPIAKIQAICDRLLTRTLEEEVKDGLQNLRKESVELHRYIQSILQISRLEASDSQLRREAADINELVERVVLQLQPLAQDKRQTLVTRLEPIFSLEIDPVMLQEVILNLVENAIKYTPTEGQIEVITQELEDRVIFSVRDNGPGIPESDRLRIFEKFYRGAAQQSAIKGTGLGLFLVKYFIELHGGEVFLESQVGKGTRAGFSLPL